MKLQDILSQDESKKTIELLKSQGKNIKIDEIKNQWNVKEHAIFNLAERPDKQIKSDKGELERIEKVARIGLALQKLIVRRAASFAFGNPVKVVSEPGGETQENILDAVQRILRDNKVSSFNRKLARELFAFTEVAEVWFPVEEKNKHEKYGFSTKFKLRKALFAPSKGDKLYPYFDETGDLVAFSREYKKEVREDSGTREKKFFTTYTEDDIYTWEEVDNNWGDPEKKPNILKKIPVVYASQDFPDWLDVQDLIERLEKLLSNFADTNDYHASPKIFVRGKILGFSKKGESGAIIEGDKDSEASYLSWQHAPESVKLEIATLLEMIYTLTQTPDITFDSIRGIGNITGIALKLLFMDPHLKVTDKMEILDEYLGRRLNIIKAFIGKFNTAWEKEADNLEMEVEVMPYMIDDFKSEVEVYMTATGNKPIISQKTAIKQAGFVNNPDEEYQQIQKEAERENIISFAEPHV